MGTRERVIFAPLVVMTLLLGVYPALALMIAPAVENLVSNYNAALLDAGLAKSQTQQTRTGARRT